MSAALAETRAPDRLYRLGHGPDPWEWPSWEYSKPDGTFGNRWDDPEGLFRVVYACTERMGTFVETLAQFRPDPAVVAGLEEIDGGGAPDHSIAPGEVPRSWLANRRVGTARVAGLFVQVGDSGSLAWLRDKLAARVVHYGLDDLDASTIRMTAPRGFTQEISRRVFEQSSNGRRAYAGIAYGSRLGDDFHNWAVFEPAEIEADLARDLTATDADFKGAMVTLGLTLVDG